MKTLRLNALFWTMLALGIAATQAYAQQPNPELADAMLRQAVAAEDQASNSEGVDAKWEAARLHEESARLRAPGDPQAVASLRAAGMYIAYDRPARAAELLVEAAQLALANGDAVTSAELYIDAATTLLGGRYRQATVADMGKARSWMSQAATIATLPDFSEEDRERILRRVGLDRGQLAG